MLEKDININENYNPFSNQKLQFEDNLKGLGPPSKPPLYGEMTV